MPSYRQQTERSGVEELGEHARCHVHTWEVCLVPLMR